MIDIDALKRDKRPQSSTLVHALIDRLEAAEKERDDVAQQLVQSEIGKREISEARDALQVEVGKLKDLEVSRCVKINGYIVDNARLAKEVERLQANIERMERQEPIATVIKKGADRYWMSERLGEFHDGTYPLYALPGAQQCKNCNGMGDRFDPSGEKIPCDLCESHLEEIRSLVAEAAHDIISGSDFWLSISLAAKKIYARPGAQTQGEKK